MIELRWLHKPNFTGIEVPDVLQYRQMVDTTIRAGMWDSKGIADTANMQWSEWRDVPTVYMKMECK